MSPGVLLTGVAVAAAVVATADLVALVRARPRRARGRRQGRGPLVDAVAALGRRAGARAGGDLRTRLLAAGTPLGLTPADVAALKAGAALLGLGVAAVWAPLLPGRLGWAALVAAPAGAFWLPDLLLARRAKARRAVLEREVADVLDLLRVAVGAGQSPERALREVARHRRGLLAAELGRTARRIELGDRAAAALGELAARCPIEPVIALVAALGRAERHGAPLDEALSALAAQARADRARRAQEAGARAAPKIQLVVALVLVPAVMLLVAASLVRGLT